MRKSQVLGIFLRPRGHWRSGTITTRPTCHIVKFSDTHGCSLWPPFRRAAFQYRRRLCTKSSFSASVMYAILGSVLVLVWFPEHGQRLRTIENVNITHRRRQAGSSNNRERIRIRWNRNIYKRSIFAMKSNHVMNCL